MYGNTNANKRWVNRLVYGENRSGALFLEPDTPYSSIERRKCRILVNH